MIENANIFGRYVAPSLGPASGIHSLQAAALRRNGNVWPINTASLPYTTNLFAHFDAADGATIFDSNSGGSQTANNGAVGRWEDKSGNGRHWIQATANNRPVLRENNRAGRAGIEFDGTNDGLTFVATLPSTATVFYVLNIETSNRVPFKEDDTTSNYFGYYHTAEGGNAVGAGTAQRWYINGREMNNWDGNMTPYFVRFWTFSNGVVTTCIKGLQLSTWSGLSIGAYTGAFFDGFAYEVIIYSEAVSDTNRALVETYLRSKWQTG